MNTDFGETPNVLKTNIWMCMWMFLQKWLQLIDFMKMLI